MLKAMGAIPAEAKATADNIAILIQTAIRKDLTERRKEIDKTRKAKKLYQQHAWQIRRGRKAAGKRGDGTSG